MTTDESCNFCGAEGVPVTKFPNLHGKGEDWDLCKLCEGGVTGIGYPAVDDRVVQAIMFAANEILKAIRVA